MFAKRIIPCLDVKDGRVVKGVNFVDLRDAGDPVEVAAAYSQAGADEVVFLDITASHEGRATAAELAARQLESVKDQFVRLTAEYDNYRKRTAKEKDNLYQDAKADTIKEFLAVYDNLERAVATEGDEDSPHKKGLEMIFHQYQEILKKLGVTEIEAQGQPFDPEKHNAVMHIDDENLGENVVSQVFQAGFLLGDKVIRHAIVQVAN